ncbi:hypothetical protein ABZ696_29535 [Streptomyces albidoflavus]|uniref:hypothetical protein n=1 Tax=Streptomyces albidoflavus TaxID=1886 RepID=UPI0033C7C442
MTTPPVQTPPPGAHPTPTPVPVHLAVGATGIHLGDLDTEPEHVRRDLAALLREAADVIERGSDDDLDEDTEP